MEVICDSRKCRRKLNDYRDMTSKLYADIDTLEADLKERNEFLQKVVKSRNDFQQEIVHVKNKNSDLIKENDDLIEKVNQLEEDTEDGLEMYEMVRAREVNLKKELEKCQEESSCKETKCITLEKEKEGIEKQFNCIKETLEKALEDGQESDKSKESQITELQKELLDLKKKSEMEQIKLAKITSDLESELRENLLSMESLKVENSAIKKRNDDILDELLVKTKELDALEIKRVALSNSGKSLNEELNELGLHKCDHCSLKFVNKQDLKSHMKRYHEERLRQKMKLLENVDRADKVLSKQNLKLTMAIFELKKKEFKDSQTCSCRGFCNITHLKHNFCKSKAEELLDKMRKIKNHQNVSKQPSLGAIQKCYTCNLCQQVFVKQGGLKKHRKTEHKIGKKKNPAASGAISIKLTDLQASSFEVDLLRANQDITENISDEEISEDIDDIEEDSEYDSSISESETSEEGENAGSEEV